MLPHALKLATPARSSLPLFSLSSLAALSRLAPLAGLPSPRTMPEPLPAIISPASACGGVAGPSIFTVAETIDPSTAPLATPGRSAGPADPVAARWASRVGSLALASPSGRTEPRRSSLDPRASHSLSPRRSPLTGEPTLYVVSSLEEIASPYARMRRLYSGEAAELIEDAPRTDLRVSCPATAAVLAELCEMRVPVMGEREGRPLQCHAGDRVILARPREGGRRRGVGPLGVHQMAFVLIEFVGRVREIGGRQE